MAKIIEGLRQKFPLSELLQYAKMSRSTFYYHQRRLNQPDKYVDLKVKIKEIFEQNKGYYGYRRVHATLRNQGENYNHKTICKLMKDMKLQGKQKKVKYRSYKGDIGKKADNILNRNFKAEKPWEKLATDVTVFSVCDEKIYLSPIIDLFNKEVVSYSISKNPNFEQTKDMLSKLFIKMPKTARPLLHSDQGWQYQHKIYSDLLEKHNITQSMSRKGNCLDNSVMENFFGRLKTEMFNGEKFNSTEEFIRKLEEYICYFNNKRVSLVLNGMSPVQYRTHSEY